MILEAFVNAIPNDQLRHEIFNYFQKKLPKTEKNKRNTQTDVSKAVFETINKFPEIIKFYIKSKEENKLGAKTISKNKVAEVESLFIQKLQDFVKLLLEFTSFYEVSSNTSHQEALSRIEFLKDVIENNDGYKLFYLNGIPIKRENDLQIIYRLTWYATSFDINREVNNGRGPVDYKISKGSKNKTLVEFKLASNSKLRQNLANQVEVYEKANKANDSIKVIMYFDAVEFKKVCEILQDLKLEKSPNIILIDAGKKASASNVT